MSTTSAPLESPRVRWDLSALYQSLDDPNIESTWARAMAAADSFAKEFRGKIDSPTLDADTLLRAVQSLERLCEDCAKPTLYANLRYAVEADNPEIGAFFAEQMEKDSGVRVKLVFFELELQSVSDDVLHPVLQDPKLDNYRHYIGRVRALKDHRLSETEEVLLEEVANVSTRAWTRLFDEVTANHVYHFQSPVTGEREELSLEEVLNHLRDSSRSVRQAAGEAFTAGLKEQERVLTFTYNTLLADKRLDDRLRRFSYPEQARHLANELEQSIVDVVEELCVANYSTVERYYKLKKEILGLATLTEIDRYAPLHEAEEQIQWEEARRIVLDAFGKFSPTLRDRADEFFEKGWIDAESRQGKTGGAFCSPNTPDTHPVIMMSYLNKLKDVETLAHELGHGVHGSLSREQTYFNFNGTLPMAELASIFAEMLVFEDLIKGANDKDRLALLADKIEGAFASVFRQIAMYRFEKRAHRQRRDSGELSAEEFGDIWQEELQAMFGTSIELSENHRIWWTYVSHFFFSPFYVYAYAFGELLTMSLYQQAKREGEPFVEKYERLLRLGGAQSPQELISIVGVDLTSREFWQGGLDTIKSLVDDFEATKARLGS